MSGFEVDRNNYFLYLFYSKNVPPICAIQYYLLLLLKCL